MFYSKEKREKHVIVESKNLYIDKYTLVYVSRASKNVLDISKGNLITSKL